MRKFSMILVSLALAAVTLALAPGPLTAPAGAAEDVVPNAHEVEALELLNAERRAHGLAPLQLQPTMVEIAREWSAQLRTNGELSHRPDLGDQISQRVTTSWRQLAENVGVGSSVATLHPLFVDSTKHRTNMLGDYSVAGVGVVEDGDRVWITVNFMRADTAVQTVALPGPGGFCDTHDSAHGDAIAELAERGITQGSNGCFYPDRTVTRGQMATFLKRTLGLSTGTAAFCDTEDSVHAGSIGMVATAGIAFGMSDGCFRPNQGVTRGQMAAFMDRAFAFADGSSGFPDTLDHAFSEEIASVAEAGVALGGHDGLYYPDELVTRAQMASFLVRALNS